MTILRNLLLRSFFKNGPTPACFNIFLVFLSKQYNITNQCEKCHVHPVYSARIRTHDLLNMNRFTLPLDQASRPLLRSSFCCYKVTLAKKIVFVFFDKLWPFDMRSFKPEIVRYCCQPNCPLTYDRILMAMTSRVLLLSTDVRVSTFNNKLCRCIKICGNSTQITCYF